MSGLSRQDKTTTEVHIHLPKELIYVQFCYAWEELGGDGPISMLRHLEEHRTQGFHVLI